MVDSSTALLQNPGPTLTKPVSEPIESQALSYFVANFVFRPDDLPNIGHEYGTYVLLSWVRTQPDSSLHMALYALSHAMYGRARHVDTALIDAGKLYANSIVRIQKEMVNPTEEGIDHLLLTIMLMGFFENVMYKKQPSHSSTRTEDQSVETGSRFWKTMCHHEGAVGLLTLRLQRSQKPKLPVDGIIRRQILRTCVLRGSTVPTFLQNGAFYGEYGPALAVDGYMVRTATLRAQSITSILSTSCGVQGNVQTLNGLISTAEELEADMSKWSDSLPDEWNFAVMPVLAASSRPSDFYYEDVVHTYSSHAHAAIWNRYRATRLIVNSIRIRALSKLLRSPADQSPLIIEQQCTQLIMDPLARDMCASLPYFFSAPTGATVLSSPMAIQVGNKVLVSDHDILPKMAVFLAWPLTIAVNTPGISARYHLWLKKKLKLVARSLGDSVLESLIDQDAYRF